MRDTEPGKRRAFLNRTGYLSAGLLLLIVASLVGYFLITP